MLDNWGSEFRELGRTGQKFHGAEDKIPYPPAKASEKNNMGAWGGPNHAKRFPHTHKKKNPLYCLCGPRSDIALWHLIKICAVNVLEKKKMLMADLL